MNTVFFSIPFAFKDPIDVREALFYNISDLIKPSEKYINKFGEDDLKIIIALDRKPKELKVMGPSTGDGIVDFTIWLPYKEIKKSPNYRLTYLDKVMEGLKKIFKKYRINTEKLDFRYLELRENIIQNKEIWDSESE